MKHITPLVVALGLATAGSAALAEQKDQQARKEDAKPQPVKMTEADMDKVAAGQLLELILVDVVDVRNVQVAVPVNASVAAGILGNAGAAAVQRPGRQFID